MKADKNTALLLIDLQKGFEDIEYWGGGRNNPDAELNASKILNAWREMNLPLFHIQHCSTTPGSPLMPGNAGNDFLDLTKPLAGEKIIQKNVNSAFIGTDLKEQLDEMGIKKLVIVGLTTDHCISTTTRMAGNFGYETYLIEDAVATFDKIGLDGKKLSAQLIHDTALASLHEEFARVIQSVDLIK
ncbi:cysteine hydrolase family protein [Marinifilum caeruleilacunae]|uniref:Cysteine hydrolase n=1 Tax=Marinifilum caeruleilacunae TaxID=2499076 RepID=A0ABX1WZ67_9BACT|nr:cysteine hydrolase family protein [Marinifilum caeruleilacunae]NOU61409.1 cysteine hydrolase [Marinifilum caeruleilacunae]